MREILRRLLTGIVYVVILLSAIFLSSNAFDFLFMAFGLACLYEFKKLTKLQGFYIFAAYLGLWWVFIYLLNSFTYSQSIINVLMFITITINIALLFYLFSMKEKQFTSVQKFLIGLFYIGGGCIFLTMIPYQKNNFENLLIMGIFILIWVNDSFAYLVGKSIGKTKLFPQVSPKKTWEGTIGGFIFAPNLPAEGTMGTIMLAIQGIAGLMILFGFYEREGGLLILILFVLGIGEYGCIEMLDTLEMVGFALYAMIIGRPKWKLKESHWMQRLMHPIHAYGYPLMRVGVGINLIILAFSEKILAPSLTHNFLQNHPWNFMQAVGMSDYWFAFSAGLAEGLFGIFFLLGLVTRVTTVALAGFLVTTLYLLGPTELIGHLPHFSIAIVLLVLGSGSRLLLVKHSNNKK